MNKKRLHSYKVVRYSDQYFEKIFTIFHKFQSLTQIEVVLLPNKKCRKSVRQKEKMEKRAFLSMMSKCNQKFIGIDEETREPYAFAFFNLGGENNLSLTLVAIDPDYTYSKTCGDSLREIFDIFSQNPQIKEIKTKLFKRNKWEKYVKFVERFGFKINRENKTHISAILKLQN